MRCYCLCPDSRVQRTGPNHSQARLGNQAGLESKFVVSGGHVSTPLPGTSYDEVPYESHPYPQTHPSRLAAVATLFGLRPPPVETARVLELGCAAGGNLIPMA